jgi:long-subunit acyl-CoA synthetase (AMP-forming)
MRAGDTLVDLFFDRAARWSHRPALRHWQDDAWQTMTWAEYGTAVREVAAGLVALGLAPGDRAGILAGNHPRWHIASRAPAERVRAWRTLPWDLTVAGGELTPTLKVKRSVATERFDELVEEMYAR